MMTVTMTMQHLMTARTRLLLEERVLQHCGRQPRLSVINARLLLQVCLLSLLLPLVVQHQEAAVQLPLQL